MDIIFKDGFYTLNLGKYANVPLSDVPSEYLSMKLREYEGYNNLKRHKNIIDRMSAELKKRNDRRANS